MKKMIFLFVCIITLLPTVIAQYPSKLLQLSFIRSSLTNADSDAIGAMHNEALEYVLSQPIMQKNITEIEFMKHYNEMLVRYFEMKGVNVQVIFQGSLDQFSKEGNASICLQTDRLSIEAKSFACTVQQNFDDVATGRISVDEFARKMDALRLQAETLKDESETKLCALTASIAKHSVEFWHRSADHFYQRFYGIFSEQSTKEKGGPSINYNSALSPNALQQRIRWWAFAVSDIYGAWNWGRYGAAAGGAAGVVALGLTGATWHSGASLISQAASGVINK